MALIIDNSNFKYTYNGTVYNAVKPFQWATSNVITENTVGYQIQDNTSSKGVRTLQVINLDQKNLQGIADFLTKGNTTSLFNIFNFPIPRGNFWFIQRLDETIQFVISKRWWRIEPIIAEPVIIDGIEIDPSQIYEATITSTITGEIISSGPITGSNLISLSNTNVSIKLGIALEAERGAIAPQSPTIRTIAPETGEFGEEVPLDTIRKITITRDVT